MASYIMRPVDKLSDRLTHIVPTSGEEVRRTARLQCPMD